MVRLIQKSGYIKAGSASGYMKYIATRKRVEKLEGSGPVTKGQRQLIENLLRVFPDAAELGEYSDYRSAPTTGSASSLISAVLDANAHNDESEAVSEVLPQGTEYGEVLEYRQAATLLCDDDVTWAEKREAVQALEQLWDKDFTSAAYHLGRAYRDGLGVLPDDEKAEEWFRRSATTGDARSQYVLGRLLQERGRLSEAVAWYEHVRFHDMRHLFATLSLKNGVDVKTLSGALGHYSAGFTLNTYTHATAQMKQDAAYTIGAVISSQM